MNTINKKLESIFKEMAAMYRYQNGKNIFRGLAYERAANLIGNLEDDISTYSEPEMEALKGIGHGIATKIEEYIATGKIAKYEELKSHMPLELIGLSFVKGFGAKTLKKIHDALGISTRGELIEALKDGRVANLKGFGQKKVDNMLRGIEVFKESEDRMLLWDAMEIGQTIINKLKHIKGVDKIELAGSIRRQKETIGDLDILVCTKPKHRARIIKEFTELPEITEILAKGETKVSCIHGDINRQIDLRLIDHKEWGAALQYFTGSKQHNVHVRSIAKNKGYKLSEYCLFTLDSNKLIAGRKEKDIYKKLGMQWMPPEIREDSGEVELALKHKIPDLIELKDIKGDLQMHSSGSDGKHSLDEIVYHTLKNYNYDYIVITDHSKSLRIAGGMDEYAFLNQIEEIRILNKKIGKHYIKAGIEVDINPDGTLDMSDEVLEQLDWVVAAIHTNYNRDNTERLIKACENPLVHMIGHPTGRMIGIRNPYYADMKEVIDAAYYTGTALEINAQPKRMDLNDKLAAMARERGVKLVISTDSHTFDHYAYMKLGVSVARRAWCRKEDILNTLSWKELMKHFSKKASLVYA